MASSKDIAAGILGFSDEEFFAADRVDVTPREVRLLESDFIGIAIDAPKRIVVTERSVLPVAVATRFDGERDWDVPLLDNCLLVACDLEHGSVWVAPGLLSEKELESRAGSESRPAAERPGPEALEGEGAQISWTEARLRMDLPWRSGRLALGAIYFDWVSNITGVELTDGEPPPPAEARAVHPRPAEIPGLPTYHRRSAGPLAPNVEANVEADFEVKLEVRDDEQSLYVSGTLAGPLRRFAVTQPFELTDGGQLMQVGAAVPVTLVVAGLGWARPWQFDWVVPVYGAPLEVGQRFEASFALDAFDGAGVPGLEAGAHASYLIFDGRIYGPRMIAGPEE